METPAALLERLEVSRRAYREAFLRGLRPDPRITVSQWADRNRQLTTRSSAEPGPWRTSRTPYLREPMDCLSTSSAVEDLTFVKGSQLGGTELGNNWLGYIVDHAPAAVMAVMPTEKVQKRKSRQVLDALFEDTPSLAAKVATRKSRDPGNTTLLKVFPGGILVLASAESAADLRSMSMRYLFLDEVDAFPAELEGEGDPVELAERGTHTFRNRKILRVSTPTIDGQSRIWRAFQATDRRYYHVPCPFCGTLQRLVWARIRWEQGDDELPERVLLELREKKRTAWYECEACRRRIDEHWKDKMLAAGVWIPEDPSLGERVRGYHLSALYSPLGMYSWTSSVARFLRAQGSPSRLRVWVNQDLGETWKEKGEAPDWRRLWELREHYRPGRAPRRTVFLTAGVDLQKDRVEYEVIGWAPGFESWSVEYVVRAYDPDDPRAWQVEVDRLLARTFEFEDGGPPAVLAGVAFDTGYEAKKVYAWAHRYGRSARLFLVKGTYGSRTPIGIPTDLEVTVGGRRIKRGLRLWTVDVGHLKEELFANLALRPPVLPTSPFPEGYCHFPQHGPEFFKSLTAEQLVRRRTKGGRVIMDWEKIRERNEALDCRVYGRAAALILGAERWRLEDWKAARELSSRFATSTPTNEDPGAAGVPAPQAPTPPPTPPRREPPDDPPHTESRWRRFRRRT